MQTGDAPKKPSDPPLAADAELRSRSSERFDATESIRRLPRSAYADPIDDWKNQALASVVASQPGTQPNPFALRLTSGFMLLVMVGGAPLGVVGWAITLLTFLSVLLVQELPSVLWARGTGRAAEVVLTVNGGAARLSGPPLGAFQSFVLALFGSLGNLGIGLALWQLAQRGVAGAATRLLSAAAVVHLVWGLLQALPLTPFRAGMALTARLRPPMRFAHALLSFLCVAVAGLGALRAAGFPGYFSLVVLVTAGASVALRDAFNDLRDEQAGVAVLTAAAAARLAEDQPEQAMELARRGLAKALVESNRTALYKTLAWSAIGKRDPFIAHGALARLPADHRDLHLVAAYLACCNRVDEAIRLLQSARRHGERASETSKLLVDLLFQSGQRSDALAVAASDRQLYAARDWEAIASHIDKPLGA